MMRFIREAQIANSVASPGIIKILDHGFLPNGESYLWMDMPPEQCKDRKVYSEGQQRFEPQAIPQTA